MPFRSTTPYHKNCKQLSLFWSRPTSVQAGRSNPSVSQICPSSPAKILEKVLSFNTAAETSIILLETKQSAYRKIHNTETALLSVVDGLLRNADDRLVSMLALLDLNAAFDTLDHPILLQRLETTFLAFLALCFTGLRPT